MLEGGGGKKNIIPPFVIVLGNVCRCLYCENRVIFFFFWSLAKKKVALFALFMSWLLAKVAWKACWQREVNCFVFVLQLNAALWLVRLLPSGKRRWAGLHTQLIEEQQACCEGHMRGWGLGSAPLIPGPLRCWRVFLKKKQKSEYKILCVMIDTLSSPKRPVISKPFLIIFLLCRKYKPVLPVFVSSYSTVGGGWFEEPRLWNIATSLLKTCVIELWQRLKDTLVDIT